MFTGIIEERGKVTAWVPTADAARVMPERRPRPPHPRERVLRSCRVGGGAGPHVRTAAVRESWSCEHRPICCPRFKSTLSILPRI